MHALDAIDESTRVPTQQKEGSQGKSGETNTPTRFERAAGSDTKLYRAPNIPTD
jgi:hypothetical protein